jgi:hypothetical protein
MKFCWGDGAVAQRHARTSFERLKIQTPPTRTESHKPTRSLTIKGIVVLVPFLQKAWCVPLRRILVVVSS